MWFDLRNHFILNSFSHTERNDSPFSSRKIAGQLHPLEFVWYQNFSSHQSYIYLVLVMSPSRAEGLMFALWKIVCTQIIWILFTCSAVQYCSNTKILNWVFVERLHIASIVHGVILLPLQNTSLILLTYFSVDPRGSK